MKNILSPNVVQYAKLHQTLVIFQVAVSSEPFRGNQLIHYHLIV